MIIIELAYSFHLGSDKNKRNISRSSAKSNKSGSTSLSNNAIQNSAGLTKVDKHNYRKYDSNQNDIEIIKGSSSLVDDVKKLYKEEFDEAKEEYNLTNTLKGKKKGRNYDYHITEMDNYLEMKEQLEKNQESLNKAKQQSDLLDNDTKEAKDIVNNLKLAFGRKDKYVITQECKDKINSFISQVENTNKEYKNIQKLSTTLTNVDSNIKENNKKIKILTENNKALELRVKSLTEKNKLKDNEIDELKEENNSLFAELNYFKSKFIRLIKFIKNRLFKLIIVRKDCYGQYRCPVTDRVRHSMYFLN